MTTQSRNPFEPPQAPVDDVDAGHVPMRRPATIARAFWLILASGGLGLLNYVARGMHGSGWPVAIGLAWVVGAAFLIRAGQNWARIVFVLFLVLGLSGALLATRGMARLGGVYVLMMWTQMALQSCAAWLTFRSPGRQWFRRDRPVLA